MSKFATPEGAVFEGSDADIRSASPWTLRRPTTVPRAHPAITTELRRGYRPQAGSRSVGFMMAIGLHVALALAWFFSGSLIAKLKTPEPVVLVDVAAPVKELPPEPVKKIEPPKLNVPVPLLQAPVVAITEPVPNTAPRAAPMMEAPLPAPPAPSVNTQAVVETFQLKLLRHLNRYKRYPAAAKSKREQGVAYVYFTMDREGRVLSARLEKTSGFVTLDDEGVALLNRAQPLPKPPADVQGNPLVMIVPIEFSVR